MREKRTLYKMWSDEKAAYHYSLDITRIYNPGTIDERKIYAEASGDKQWAIALVNHYKDGLTIDPSANDVTLKSNDR